MITGVQGEPGTKSSMIFITTITTRIVYKKGFILNCDLDDNIRSRRTLHEKKRMGDGGINVGGIAGFIIR